MATPQKYVVFTTLGESTGIAWQLKRAGKEVIFGIVDDLKLTGNDVDSPEIEKRRKMMGKGLLDVRKAETLVEEMQHWRDKDEWFVFFDFSNQWRLANKLKDFKYGLFPSRFDYEMETDRNLAKDFVKHNYPLLTLPETQEFKKCEDACEFLEESEEFWALKGNNPAASTVVPSTTVLEHAREEIVEAITADKSVYESKGFILERQIRGGTEVCVEGMFWNGELIATTIDMEHKAMGSANLSYQIGCANNLIHEVPMDCDLVKMGIPDAVHKIAKKHRGLFFMDANIIFKDGIPYFLEFCVRPGYDALVTEMEMSGGPAEFFEAISEGENPFKYSYGVAVRGTNLKQVDGMAKANIRMRWAPETEDHIYPFNIAQDNGHFFDTGFGPDCVVFTEASDDHEYAAIKAFEVAGKFSFESLYYRPHSDWTCRSYEGNIHDRLEGVEKYICSPVDGG